MKTYIVIVTQNGKITKFLSSEVRPQTRKGMGIGAMQVVQGDKVVAAFLVTE